MKKFEVKDQRRTTPTIASNPKYLFPIWQPADLGAPAGAPVGLDPTAIK